MWFARFGRILLNSAPPPQRLPCLGGITSSDLARMPHLATRSVADSESEDPLLRILTMGRRHEFLTHCQRNLID